MTPLKLLELVYATLSESDCKFAVTGGLACSFYRKQPRLTNDVDIAILTEDAKDSRKSAEKILKSSGLEVSLGWIYSGAKSKVTPISLVIGKVANEDQEPTVDFILPVLPWVKQAVERAQYNLIDFGFAKLPMVTPEDLIISKAYALRNEPNRFQDLDDLKSIFSAKNDLQLPYLVGELERLEITLPEAIKSFLPKGLFRLVSN